MRSIRKSDNFRSLLVPKITEKFLKCVKVKFLFYNANLLANKTVNNNSSKLPLKRYRANRFKRHIILRNNEWVLFMLDDIIL